jgi:hypothetical protein
VRAVLALLLGILIAGGLWLALGAGDGDRGSRSGAGSGDEALRQNPHLTMKTGTLVVRVQAPDRSVPAGAQVGYLHAGQAHLFYVDAAGRHEMTDVPIGDVVVLAQAPGYEEKRLARTLLPGVPDEVILELKRVPDR